MDEVVKSKSYPEVSGTYPWCCSCICSKRISSSSCQEYGYLMTIDGLSQRAHRCMVDHGVGGRKSKVVK